MCYLPTLFVSIISCIAVGILTFCAIQDNNITGIFLSCIAVSICAVLVYFFNLKDNKLLFLQMGK